MRLLRLLLRILKLYAQAWNDSQLLVQGYKALSPLEQDAVAHRFAKLKDSAHLVRRDLDHLEAKHVAMERQYIDCRIQRDDLLQQVRSLLRLTICLLHPAGVTAQASRKTARFRLSDSLMRASTRCR